ncbi:pyrimidine/purine nucleoside phosphorylase [Vibrio vulnificus]|uniref:pyrimidine/purine nucleoside phosphorylase n=1 Tax=Vibrio vulnificus TaxID=672 RepID=UPI003C12FEF5
MIKENSYFAGNVKSLGFNQQGEDSSVGVMLPGNYTFGTDAPERMTVVKGALVIKREGDEEWSTYQAGETLEVGGKMVFGSGSGEVSDS